MIDKVFIINLEHRTDRKEAILKQLAKVGVSDYEFFPAIRPTEVPSGFLDPMPGWFKGDVAKYKIGSLGCLLSHRAIMKICIERNYQNVLILEDDTEFQIGCPLDSVWDIVKPPDFGLLYLAGNHRGSTLFPHSKYLVKVQGTLTTGSYVVNRSIMQAIVDGLEQYDREVDIFYVQLQSHYPCYCIYPHVARQADSFSDIVQREVSYDL
jgi:glycosyl transferase family 25